MNDVSKTNHPHHSTIPLHELNCRYNFQNMEKLKVRSSFLLLFFYYFSTLVGTCPFIYDSKANAMRFSKIRSSIGIVLYGVSIGLLIPIRLHSANKIDYSKVLTKDFVSIVEGMNEYTKNIISIISLAIFIKNRNQFRQLFNGILALDKEEISFESEKWFTSMVATKIGVGLVVWIFSFSWFFMNFKDLNLIIITLFWCHTSVFIFQLFSVNYFYMAVALISKSWKATNIRLTDRST